MTAATATLRSLVPEGIAQPFGSSRDLQPEDHTGHGCCLEPDVRRSLIGRSSDGDARAVVLQLRCKSVNRCVCCRAVKRRRDTALAFAGAAHGGKVAMVTFTIDLKDGRFAEPANRRGRRRPRASSMLEQDDRRAYLTEESLRYASWAWNRLRTNLSRPRKRHSFGRMAYLRAVELHRSGVAHYHVLIRVEDVAAFGQLRAALRGNEQLRTKVDPSSRYAGLAIMAGFGKVVDVQLARSRQDVARYVTKMAERGVEVSRTTADRVARDGAAYTTKGVTAPMPRYTRRTASSRGSTRMDPWAPGWTRPTPLAGFTWQLAAASASTVRRALELSDWTVLDPASLRITAAGGP